MSRFWIFSVFLLLPVAACDLGAPLRVVDERREVLSIQVTPEAQTVAVGSTATFTVRIVGRGDQTLTEFDATWGVGDPTVAAVDAPGTIRGLQPGTTEILVRAGGRTGSARVTVR